MRISERRLRRLIRHVIRESVNGDVHILWMQVDKSLRDDDYYRIDELRMDFEDLDPDSVQYEEYRERFEDSANEWMSNRNL